MRIPYFLKGALFGPILIGLILVLKVSCPASINAGCLSDYLAVPIFLPLIFVYKVIEDGRVMIHELWFVLLYWSLVGLLVGAMFDLYTRRSEYSPAPRPPL